ncbi:MAG: hypothetical protein KGL39_25195 [Patescibacteria group bacterium]|nr:hypothetical protein [Patescibacteria group bacterium]
MTPAKPAPSGEMFAARMREIAETYSGDELHRRADALMCDTMDALGYGEGVAVFLRAVGDAHTEDCA